MRRVKNPIPIPLMVHPLGKQWEQPDRTEITFAFQCAWVSKEAFQKLKSYDVTYPSALYAGKMWKRKYHLKHKAKLQERYVLHYVVDSEKEGYVEIKDIELIIDEKRIPIRR